MYVTYARLLEIYKDIAADATGGQTIINLYAFRRIYVAYPVAADKIKLAVHIPVNTTMLTYTHKKRYTDR